MKGLYLIGTLIFTTAVAAWANSSAAMSTDTELFLIDENVLKGRVIPAVSSFVNGGDPGAAKQLVQEAISSRQFQTALKSHSNVDRMTAEYLARGSKQLLDGSLPKEILDDTGEVIRDREVIRRHQTETILTPFLVYFLCSWSRDGSQTRVPLSHSPLTDYLRSQSPWMDEMLGSSNELLWDAPDMPLPMGGEAKLLTEKEARTLLDKLQEVAPPSEGQELINQYEDLKQLLQIAAQEPRFRVLIRTV